MLKRTFKKERRSLLAAGLILWTTLTGAVNTSAAGDPLASVDIPDVVAKVNGMELNSEFIKFRMSRDLERLSQQPTLEQKKKMVRDLIDREVVRELIRQDGEKQNKTVPASLVNKELATFKEELGGEQQFQDMLKKRNLTEEKLRTAIYNAYLTDMVLREKVKGKIQIEDNQVRSFYESQKDRFHRPEAYRVQHIFIPLISPDLARSLSTETLRERLPDLEREARRKIDRIYVEVQKGGDFAELARKYSEDEASAKNGGDLDFIYKGVLDPSFDAAIAKMKPGEISDIVKTRFGYHIIKLNAIKPAEDVPFDAVKEEIQKYLVQEEARKLVESYVESLRKKAQIKILY